MAICEVKMYIYPGVASEMNSTDLLSCSIFRHWYYMLGLHLRKVILEYDSEPVVFDLMLISYKMTTSYTLNEFTKVFSMI